MTETVLSVQGISKSFPGVKALDGVSFEVRPGTVHALCGENGAGKSTLMKIINGIYQPDAGTIRIRGEEVRIKNPIDARARGIAMIAQELNYVPDMTFAENFFLVRLPRKAGRVDWRFVNKEATRLLREEGLNYSPNRRLSTLTVSEVQTLEILRAVYHSADVLIMDEPTSAIAHCEVESLFRKIRALRAEGKSIIYISHKMDEVFELADDITVLRDGAVVKSQPATDIDLAGVITQMVGAPCRRGWRSSLRDHRLPGQLTVGDRRLRPRTTGQRQQAVRRIAVRTSLVDHARCADRRPHKRRSRLPRCDEPTTHESRVATTGTDCRVSSSRD